MYSDKKMSQRGFTLLELMIAIIIIGVIGAVIFSSLGESRARGRDANRKTQVQEVLKALELYYSDNNTYPLVGGSSNTGGYLDTIDPSFYGSNTYISGLPEWADTDYYYCVSVDQKTIALSVNTELDIGITESDWCQIIRGPGGTGCDAWLAANATELCGNRF